MQHDSGIVMRKLSDRMANYLDIDIKEKIN